MEWEKLKHLPPPFCWQRYGNLHIFPRPTEYPMILRKNCILPDHAARSPSTPPAPASPSFRPSAEPLFDAIELRCDADKTIVTPCVPSPRARVFSGAISWPLRGPFIDSNFAVILSLSLCFAVQFRCAIGISNGFGYVRPARCVENVNGAVSIISHVNYPVEKRQISTKYLLIPFHYTCVFVVYFIFVVVVLKQYVGIIDFFCIQMHIAHTDIYVGGVGVWFMLFRIRI